MQDSRYIVLLNDVLKRHFLSLPDRERARMREKFEFLENGFWDAGVRVKKLKGAAGRVVFEARLNRADRMLFTIGRHGERSAVYVWGVSRHDDVRADAARILPRNAPFMDFEPVETEQRDDLSMDSLPVEWMTQEDVEQKVPEDYGPQRWLVLDDEEWKRILASPDPLGFEAFLFLTREQEELLRAAPPVLLSGTAGSGKTTLCVYYLLRGASRGTKRLFLTYNPLLKELAERMYAGLTDKRGGRADAVPRFMTFRELLLEVTAPEAGRFPARREAGLAEFEAILGDHKDRKKYDAELVWEEIRSIVKGSKLPLSPARLEKLAAAHQSGRMTPSERDELREHLLGLRELSLARRAEKTIEKRTGLGDYDGFLRAMEKRDPDSAEDRRRVLDEILRLVSKHASDFTSPLLSLEEYLALGKKRAPSFLYDRREIYGIAEFYQDRLARGGLWDEIDMSKTALRLMDGASGEFSHDLVVCDEVQDLTDVQVALLFRLASRPDGLVLAGDPRQIVNPSGFRWEEVKNKLYERGLPVPTVHKLSLNFRCVGSIVKLSNALLDLKAGLVGLSDTEMREEWKFGGKPPLLLENIPEKKALSCMDLHGAGHAVLTRTQKDRDEVKAALSTELVFTIAEAKGLEFDAVFLWKFCADEKAESVWKSIASGRPVDHPRLPHVRHELSLLYVAATRARGALIIYDGRSPSVVWDIPSVSPLVFRTSDTERLSELWGTVSTPAEWEAQGDYFLSHGHLAAARECFKNAGNDKKLLMTDALISMKAGDFALAAPLFEECGDPRRAAECFELALDWRRALGLWEALGENERAAPCKARAHEAGGDFEEAARQWEDMGRPQDALRCWEKAGANDRVGRALAAAGEHGRAAQLLEKAGLLLEAAASYAKTGETARAADLYLRGGDVARAARLYKKCKDRAGLLKCYQWLGDFLSIARYYESENDAGRAMDAYARYAEASEENRETLLAGIPAVKSVRSALKAGIRYGALGVPDKAAPFFLRAGFPELAAVQMEKAGDFKGLAACYERMHRYMDAARALERSGMEGRELVETLQRMLYRHLDSLGGKERKEAEAMHAEAKRMRAEGRPESALARFRLLGDDESVKGIYVDAGRLEEAVDFFLDTDNPGKALECAASPGTRINPASVKSLMDRRLRDESPLRLREGPASGFFIPLLDRLEADGEPARSVVEEFVTRIYGPWMDADQVPASALNLLIKHRAFGAIVRFMRNNALVYRQRKSMEPFVQSIEELCGRKDDPELAACAALAKDGREFERRAAALTLTDENLPILGMSATRYREAVSRLMEKGRTKDALYYCRVNNDPALAGKYAEKTGDLQEALRMYMEAREYEAALRCCLAAGDKRGEARVYERLGRIPEAFAVWKVLGSKANMARLKKKYPLAILLEK